jgi:ribonuclease D
MIVHNIYHNDIPPNVTFGNSIAIDTESLGLNINRDRLCLAQMCDEKQNVYFIKFDGTDYSAPNFRKILEDEKILKIFHFARFDVAALCHYLNIPKINNIFCTKIASKLVRTYTDSHGLKSICKELLNVELEFLTEKQKKYAASDVLYLHEIHSILSRRLELQKRTEIAQAFFDVLHTVCKCDLIGFDSASIINHH